MIIALLVLGIVIGGAVDGESGSMFGGALGLLLLVVGYFAPAPPRDDTVADTGP